MKKKDMETVKDLTIKERCSRCTQWQKEDQVCGLDGNPPTEKPCVWFKEGKRVSTPLSEPTLLADDPPPLGDAPPLTSEVARRVERVVLDYQRAILRVAEAGEDSAARKLRQVVDQFAERVEKLILTYQFK